MPYRIEDLEEAFDVEDEPSAPGREPSREDVPFSDDELIAKALLAKDGDKFRRLWTGDNSEYDGDESRGDLAFAAIAAFWTGNDPARIDAWFRQSGRMRDKWDERHASDGRTYGQMTIGKAIAGDHDIYRAARVSWNGTNDGVEPEENPLADGDPGRNAPPKRFTDVGNAAFLVARYGMSIRYATGFGYLTWDGKRWRRDADSVVLERLAQRAVRHMYRVASQMEDKDRREALVKHAQRSEELKRILAMVRLARSQPGIAISADDFDRDPWLLNCENGTVDLRFGTLGPHRRGDLITKLAPAAFNADAKCPRWIAFLDRIFSGNAELIHFVQRAVGYALTGDVSERVLFIFYGKGRNGKTTLLNVMMMILGDYARQAAPNVLMMKKTDQHPTDIADLAGARFVAAIEVEEHRRLSEVTVKQMTGNDRMKARFMRQDNFEFTPTHKTFLATNHKPVIRGTDDAIWDRLRLTPFLVRITEEEDDKQLRAKLLAEATGVLAWAVEGALAWQREGLGTPADVQEATQAYRRDMDVLGYWIGDCCVVSATASATSAALYTSYAQWCVSAGERDPLTKTAFGIALEERGFPSDRGPGGKRIRRGLALNGTSFDSESDVSDT